MTPPPQNLPSILVVDDEKQIRTAISRPLRKLGYTVRQAADGIEAIENIAEHGPPTLIVLDLAMPRMDGRQVLARVRQNHPHLPVLICTASEAQDLQGRQRVAVLAKPWSLDQFMAKLRLLLSSDEPDSKRGPKAPGLSI